MTASLGEHCLIIAMLVASVGFIAGLAAAKLQSVRLLSTARWCIGLLAGLMTVSALALLYALMSDDFSLNYINFNSERALAPWYIKVSAFWASQEGSLLLWGWFVTVLSFWGMLAWRKDRDPDQGVTLAVLIAACGFFAALISMVPAANPFANKMISEFLDKAKPGDTAHLLGTVAELEVTNSQGELRLGGLGGGPDAAFHNELQASFVLREGATALPVKFTVKATEKEPHVGNGDRVTVEGALDAEGVFQAGYLGPGPSDGKGLNPILQTWAMAVHPPPVFLGYALATIPFALLIGGLATGNLGAVWLLRIRRWTLWTWLFLGIGIVLGSEWAYEELAFGGYWAWDPVENASLLPWLTATALLHTLMVQQHRQMCKKINAALIAGTFILCLVATYVTRSGISDIHSFGESMVSKLFLGAILVCLALSCVLIIGAGRPAFRFFMVGLAVYVVLVAAGTVPPDAADDSSIPLLSGLSSLVRRGEVQNVHVACLAALILAGFWLTAPAFGERRPFENLLSRDGAFLAIAALLVAMTLMTLYGTLYSILTKWLTDIPKSQGKEFYNSYVAPMAVVLAGLMAFGPFLAYGRPPVKRRALALVIPVVAGHAAMIVAALLGVHRFWALACVVIVTIGLCVIVADMIRSVAARIRAAGENPVLATLHLLGSNHRRYGGQLVHLGMLLTLVGITGSSLYPETKGITLAPGKSATVGGYDIGLDRWYAEYRTVEDKGIDVEAAKEMVANSGRPDSPPFNPKYFATAADLTISQPGKPNQPAHVEKRNYQTNPQLFRARNKWLIGPLGGNSKVAIMRDGMARDLYIKFADFSPPQKVAITARDGSEIPYYLPPAPGKKPAGELAFEVIIFPLISWIWVGAVLIALGGIYSLLPMFRRGQADELSPAEPADQAGDDPPQGPGKPINDPTKPSRYAGQRKKRR